MTTNLIADIARGACAAALTAVSFGAAWAAPPDAGATAAAVDDLPKLGARRNCRRDGGFRRAC